MGESRADFVHKVNVALKELVETRGWLRFIIIAPADLRQTRAALVGGMRRALPDSWQNSIGAGQNRRLSVRSRASRLTVPKGSLILLIKRTRTRRPRSSERKKAMTDYLADVKHYDPGADEAVVNKIVRHLGISCLLPNVV